MSDLRTRIITALLSEDDVALMADAVIAELGLRREDRDGFIVRDWLGQPIRIREPRHRYVTDWTTKTLRDPDMIAADQEWLTNHPEETP